MEKVEELSFSKWLKWFIEGNMEGALIKFEVPYNVKAVTFSKAKFIGHSQKIGETLDIGLHVRIKLMDLFVGVKEVFRHHLQKPQDSIEEHFSKPVGNAHSRFVKFLVTARPVLKMLAEMASDKSLKEAEFNVFVARNILQPLSGGQCLINNDHFNAVEKCREQHDGNKENIFLPQEMNWGGLGMGFEDGFYGEPDLIVIPEGGNGFATVFQTTCANITDKESEDEEKKEEQGGKKKRTREEEEMEVGKKKKKKRKEEEEKEEKEEGESSEPADSSPGGKTVIEEKKTVRSQASASDLSQCFATAISFSQIQNQRHKEFFSFPVIRIHPKGFDIIIYNCKRDLLYLKSFSWTAKSCAALWIVLHHKIFPIQFPPNIEKYSCGYLKVVQSLDMLPKGDGWYGVNKSELKVHESTLIQREVDGVSIRLA